MARKIGEQMFEILLYVILLAAVSKGCHDNNCCNTVCMIQDAEAVCCKESQGRMRFQPKYKLLEVCDGTEWLQIDLKPPLGSKANPGTSCQHILNKMKNKASAKDGIYWIKFRGAVMPVYCDMRSDGGGWTMVFKAVAGINGTAPGILWQNSRTINQYNRNVLNVTNQVKENYKNSIVLKPNWMKFRPRQAKVVLYEGGKTVLKLTFNARNTNNMNWFALSKLDKKNLPWRDLRKKKPFRRVPDEIFSIYNRRACHVGGCRTFFINNNYGGCPKDSGWLVFGGKTCKWERNDLKYKPAILYSNISSHVNWNKRDGTVGEADVLAVFVR